MPQYDVKCTKPGCNYREVILVKSMFSELPKCPHCQSALEKMITLPSIGGTSSSSSSPSHDLSNDFNEHYLGPAAMEFAPGMAIVGDLYKCTPKSDVQKRNDHLSQFSSN